MEAKKLTFEWECPECGATWQKHGKGTCEGGRGRCEGLICECDDFSDSDDHGRVLGNKCRNAVCTHCLWGGVLPRAPKRLAPWEKKALEAGWAPPAKRAAELGLKEMAG